MKKQPGLTTGIAEPERVDAFVDELDHPLKDVVIHLRKFFRSCDKQIGEGIFWNGPTFYFTGKMKPFDPKDYRRYIAGLNLFKKDVVRVILLRGASVEDPTGLLEGVYADGRRIIPFASVADVKRKQRALKAIVAQLVRSMK